MRGTGRNAPSAATSPSIEIDDLVPCFVECQAPLLMVGRSHIVLFVKGRLAPRLVSISEIPIASPGLILFDGPLPAARIDWHFDGVA